MRISSLAVALLLAGCGAAEAPRLSLLDRAPREVQALYGGAVLVRGPEGYCIDPEATRPRQGVAGLAACLHLGGTDRPEIDGALTVEVGAAGSASVAGNEAALSDMLGGAEGLTQLGAAGDKVSVVEAGAGLVVVRILHSDGRQDWRAFLDVAGRLAGIGVVGGVRTPLTPDAAQRLLQAAVIALQAANASPA